MSLESLTPAGLSSMVEAEPAVLVDLRADWCQQCGPQETVLERLAPQYASRVRFGSLDLGEFPEIADIYGVIGLPAILLFKEGQLFELLSGFKRAPLVRISLERMLREPTSAA